jgi:endoribonuclease symE
MARKRKDYRELTVSSFSGYGCKSAPMLRLQGLWLEELGFNIGDPILVRCEDGQLIITLDHARAEAEAREQAFLDGEMKRLQKRFDEEKKKIYQQVVAEREERYGA